MLGCVQQKVPLGRCVMGEDPPVQADRAPVPMTGNPVPSGHAAQARVAPLPDARGWASSHTARHIEHRVGLQRGQCALVAFTCQHDCNLSLCSEVHLHLPLFLDYVNADTLFYQSQWAHQHNT